MICKKLGFCFHKICKKLGFFKGNRIEHPLSKTTLSFYLADLMPLTSTAYIASTRKPEKAKDNELEASTSSGLFRTFTESERKMKEQTKEDKTGSQSLIALITRWKETSMVDILFKSKKAA